MSTQEPLSFTEEAEVRMQELAEFLARDTRVNLALTSQLHDHDVLLTPGGFLMLAIPLIEGARLNAGATPPPAVVRDAVGGLLAALKSEPAAVDERMGEADVRSIVVGRKRILGPKPIELGPRGNLRSSFSVIRALAKRFGALAPYSG